MKYEIYKDKAGKWRWRFVASNGRIMADSGQGYTRLRSCKEAIETIWCYHQEARYAAIRL
jgi:hypothetical protein